MKNYFLFFLVPVIVLLSSSKVSLDGRPVKILHQMYDSINNVKTLRMKISATERIEKKFFTANSEIKLQSNPRKIYFINKKKKLEILYNSVENAEKAIVKPHVFPYFTLHLDPHGNMMRKNQHYTIHELGFEFIGRSVLLTISKDKEGVKNFSYMGKLVKNGYSCHLLQYENKSYGYTDYVVGERETATSISYKLCVNDYLLRYRNDLLNDFGFLKKGKVIKVPSLYCQKAVLYIDERTFFPIAVSLFDDVGIFESYEFSGIEHNRAINESEFSKDYKDYHF